MPRIREVIARVGEFQSRRALKLAQEVRESGLSSEQLWVALQFYQERMKLCATISNHEQRRIFSSALFDIAFGLKSVDDEATELLKGHE